MVNVQTMDHVLSTVAGATGQCLQSVPDPVMEVFSPGQELARIQRKICSGVRVAENGPIISITYSLMFHY